MFRPVEKKIVAWKDLPLLAESLKVAKSIVVSSNGCFDILHWGHLRYLNEAKGLGDVLIVAINSDASVKRLKGPSRPLFSETVRAKQLASMTAVDHVVIFEEDTPVEFLRILQPKIHVKGADYKGKVMPERGLVESWGGRIELLPLEDGFSTTSILEKLKSLPHE